MNIMTKHGSQDNIVTYEHYCDTKADLANIPQDQISLGSVAIVLKDEDDSMGIYLANSSKEWIPFSNSGGGSGMSDISLTNLLDISLANPADGQTLVYNGETEKWENKGNNLVGLGDVDISDPADGDTLTYDSTNEKWVAQAGGSGSSGAKIQIVHFTKNGYDFSLNGSTYSELVEYVTSGTWLIGLSYEDVGGVENYRWWIMNGYNTMEERIEFSSVSQDSHTFLRVNSNGVQYYDPSHS